MGYGVVDFLLTEMRLLLVEAGRFLVSLLLLTLTTLSNQKNLVYDLLANKRTVKISAHADDVNSCCWADTNSGNVLVSASDDTFLKVW